MARLTLQKIINFWLLYEVRELYLKVLGGGPGVSCQQRHPSELVSSYPRRLGIPLNYSVSYSVCNRVPAKTDPTRTEAYLER